MLKPEEMLKLTIVGHKDLMKDVVEELHRLKVLDIVDHTKDNIDIGEPFKSADRLAEILLKIRSLIAQLDIDQDVKSHSDVQNYDLDKIQDKSTKLLKEVTDIQEKIKNNETSISKNEALVNELKIIKNLDTPLENFSKEIKSIVNFVGKINDIKRLKSDLKSITNKFELDSFSDKDQDIIALFVESSKENEVKNILNVNGYQSINVQNFTDLKGTSKQNLDFIEKRISSLKNENEVMQDKIKRISKDNSKLLIDSERLISTELEKSEAPFKVCRHKKCICNKWVGTF